MSKHNIKSQNTDFNRIHLTNKNWVQNLVKMQCHFTDFDQINLTNKKSKILTGNSHGFKMGCDVSKCVKKQKSNLQNGDNN